MISKTDLKALIPRGKHKEVAEKAGVSTGAVSKFFSEPARASFRIQKAAMEVAAECKSALEPLQKALQS